MTAHVLTIDVEDWFHSLEPEPRRWEGFEDRIQESVDCVLDLLAEQETHATFFVLGDVALRHPFLVEKIARQGHEVASHGCEHRLVYRQNPEEFAVDVRRSMELLAAITGRKVLGYRAPYFSITRDSLWALGVLSELGLQYDSSIFPVINHRYGIPSAPRLAYQTAEGLLEIPPSTCRVAGCNIPCAGGVYFRIFPYAATHRLLSRLKVRGEPIVFYLHPWELDAKHPRIKVPPALRVRHYWGLSRTADKLRRLLHDFRFQSIAEAYL